MYIDFRGRLSETPLVRVGFIGCGSHSFRNLYPTLQFLPVDLVAVCDLDLDKARAFADRFGGRAAYAGHHQMLDAGGLDAVFICTGYDEGGRPSYPQLAVDCLAAGCHVWTEKPPAASCAEIDRMRFAALKAERNVMVGFKKMFFPATEKARELMGTDDFGTPHLVTIQYPQYVPDGDEFKRYAAGERVPAVVVFLDHLCHPASVLVFLLGMPQALHYARSAHGGGLATFRYASGAIASIALTHGASNNGGMERIAIVSDRRRHLSIENNTRLTLHRSPPVGYGNSPSFYTGTAGDVSAVWEPEFSLGQLYNKGLFLLGYYNEMNEFVRSVLERRPPAKGTLEQARQVTRIFEAFAEGPDREILL